MKISFAKILIFVTIFSGIIFGANQASAQNSTCNVTGVNIRTTKIIPNPTGDDDGDGETNFQEEIFYDTNRPYVYFDIQTTGCTDANYDYDLELSLTERDGGADDDVNGIEELDNFELDVPSDTFTIAYVAGEDECETNGSPDCEYHIEIWDGNSSGQEWSSLNYSCDVNCDEDWQFIGFVSYGANYSGDTNGTTLVENSTNETCNVIYAAIRHNITIPNGTADDDGDGETNFQEEFYIDNSHPYVYLDIKTIGCVDNNIDFDMEISLTENDDYGGDDDVNGIPQLDDWNIDVPSANFTIAYLAGEDECEVTEDPDCEYHIEIWDSNSSAEVWSSLNYSCDVSCEEDWQFLQFLPYGTNMPQDSTGVAPTGSGSYSSSVYDDYLAPLPGLSGQPATLQGFLQGVFNVAIVLAGILAILMLVIGGITYLSFDALGKKESGREMMTNAVLGLILALGSWVIINTINPNLADNLKITIPKTVIDGTTEEWAGGTATTGTNICPGRTLGGNPVTQGSYWPDDSNQRNALGAVNISVVSSSGSNCAGPNGAGTAGCTSVYFEGGAVGVINKLIQLKQNCPGCDIVVTGGSECWLHKTHGPNRNIVDLRKTPTLNAYINSFYGNGSGGTAFPTGKKINVPGIGRFWAEPSSDQHWHVSEL